MPEIWFQSRWVDRKFNEVTKRQKSGTRKLRPSGNFGPLSPRDEVLGLFGAAAPSNNPEGCSLRVPLFFFSQDVELSQTARAAT